MMKFRITGADRKTGAEVSTVVEAATPSEAEELANRMGWLVEDVSPAGLVGVCMSLRPLWPGAALIVSVVAVVALIALVGPSVSAPQVDPEGVFEFQLADLWGAPLDAELTLAAWGLVVWRFGDGYELQRLAVPSASVYGQGLLLVGGEQNPAPNLQPAWLVNVSKEIRLWIDPPDEHKSYILGPWPPGMYRVAFPGARVVHRNRSLEKTSTFSMGSGHTLRDERGGCVGTFKLTAEGLILQDPSGRVLWRTPPAGD